MRARHIGDSPPRDIFPLDIVKRLLELLADWWRSDSHPTSFLFLPHLDLCFWKLANCHFMPGGKKSERLHRGLSGLLTSLPAILVLCTQIVFQNIIYEQLKVFFSEEHFSEIVSWCSFCFTSAHHHLFLRCSFYINQVTDLLPVTVMRCNNFLQLIPVRTTLLSGRAFWRHVA